MNKISAKKSPQKNAPSHAPVALTHTVWLTHLSARLGPTYDECRALCGQHLQHGPEWDTDATGHVALTPAAAEKLRALVLGGAPSRWAQLVDVLRQRAVLCSATGLPERLLAPTVARLTVHRAAEFIKNPHLVQARLEADDAHPAGTLVKVFVRDNRQFRPGDAIEARFKSGEFYDLTSRPPLRRLGG